MERNKIRGVNKAGNEVLGGFSERKMNSQHKTNSQKNFNFDGNFLVEVRMHGRGGQGMVTASFILASALVEEGFYVQAFPEFGPERRGAPVKAYLRFSNEYIYKREPVVNPDVVVVSDESLFTLDEVFDGIKNSTIFVANLSDERLDEKLKLLREKGVKKIYFVDALSISLDILKRSIVNTAMVGAFIKAVGKPSIESVKKVIGNFVKNKDGNISVVELSFQKTKMMGFEE